MMDFPASPTIGQKYTPSGGGPTYTWDGAKWVAVGGAAASIYVGDSPPAGVAPGALWWDSTGCNTYVLYNDGNSIQWVIASPIPDVSQFVQKTGDTMTGALTLAADPAAPLQAATMQYVDAGDSGVRDNVLMNGLFDNWQRGANPAVVGTGALTYTADRWLVSFLGSVGTVSLVNPNARLTTGAKGRFAMQIAGNLANTFSYLGQRIESVVANRIAGRQVTLQAWITNNTGADIVPVLYTYTPSAQDNWASPVIDINGANFQTCPNGTSTLIAYTFLATVSANLGYQILFMFPAMNTTGKNVQIMEVCLCVTPGEPTGINNNPVDGRFKAFPDEMANCLRYYWAMPSCVYVFPCVSSGGYAMSFKHMFPLPMRTAPSVSTTYSGTSNFTSNTRQATNQFFFSDSVTGTAAGNTAFTLSATCSAEL